MNGNARSTPRDFDPDTAPDLSGDGWPEKFARAQVRRGRPPLASPKVSTTIRLSPDGTRPLQGWRSWLADADQRGATRMDPAPGPHVIVPRVAVKAGGCGVWAGRASA